MTPTLPQKARIIVGSRVCGSVGEVSPEGGLRVRTAQGVVKWLNPAAQVAGVQWDGEEDIKERRIDYLTCVTEDASGEGA